jgi:hypothetical protein
VTLSQHTATANGDTTMGLARDVARAVSLAAVAGIAVGGAFGLLAPASAEAGATTPAAATVPAGTTAPTDATVPVGATTTTTTTATTGGARQFIVTSVDLLGSAELDVTVRFTNNERAVERIEVFTVLADGRPLARRSTPAAIDLRPGGTADETIAFAAPAPTASLMLTLASGEQLALEI